MSFKAHFLFASTLFIIIRSITFLYLVEVVENVK